jgi:pyridoxal phosphate enzyme (YggS family)
LHEMNPGAQSASQLGLRLQQVSARIAAAAVRAGRAPEEVTLVAVTKTHPPERVLEALAAGAADFGENRVQEAEKKIPQVGRQAAHWHLIGHLQSNKARKAVALFDVIHSLDSLALARRLERFCVEDNREVLPVLIQVDLGHEKTKSGVGERELPGLVKAMAECEHLRLQGLMTLPPYFDEPERVRPFFRTLRELRDGLRSQGAFGDARGELSMGMTHDYEIAIAEGATMVRIGTAIFGERNS